MTATRVAKLAPKKPAEIRFQLDDDEINGQFVCDMEDHSWSGVPLTVKDFYPILWYPKTYARFCFDSLLNGFETLQDRVDFYSDPTLLVNCPQDIRPFTLPKSIVYSSFVTLNAYNALLEIVDDLQSHNILATALSESSQRYANPLTCIIPSTDFDSVLTIGGSSVLDRREVPTGNPDDWVGGKALYFVELGGFLLGNIYTYFNGTDLVPNTEYIDASISAFNTWKAVYSELKLVVFNYYSSDAPDDVTIDYDTTNSVLSDIDGVELHTFGSVSSGEQAGVNDEIQDLIQSITNDFFGL